MTTASILCGVDETQHARVALKVADRLARKLDLRLVVVHVSARMSEPVALTRSSMAPTAVREQHASRELIEHIVVEEGVAQAETRSLWGNAAECLADAADEEEAELIVVGSRGLGAFRATFLGSVSNALIGIARCPVLVVPPGAAPETRDSN